MSRRSFLLRVTRHLLLRWVAALAWTALVCLLMLLPGEDSLAEDTSGFFGGTDMTDAFGHVLLFGILTALWYAVLACHLAPAPALRRALVIGVACGLLLELGQGIVPERGLSLLDLTANALGALASFAALRTPVGRLLAPPR
ncbi:MAG: hypothetical protein AB1435_14100 [Chloroflexota bacterium]